MDEVMKVRIETAKGGMSAKVTNLETGQMLPVLDLALQIRPNQPTMAHITLWVEEIDVECEAKVTEQHGA